MQISMQIAEIGKVSHAKHWACDNQCQESGYRQGSDPVHFDLHLVISCHILSRCSSGFCGRVRAADWGPGTRICYTKEKHPKILLQNFNETILQHYSTNLPIFCTVLFPIDLASWGMVNKKLAVMLEGVKWRTWNRPNINEKEDTADTEWKNEWKWKMKMNDNSFSLKVWKHHFWGNSPSAPKTLELLSAGFLRTKWSSAARLSSAQSIKNHVVLQTFLQHVINKWKEVAECHVESYPWFFQVVFIGLLIYELFLGLTSAKGHPEETEAFTLGNVKFIKNIGMLAVKRAPRSSA